MTPQELHEVYEYRSGLLYRKKGGGGERVGAVVGYLHVSNGRPYRRCCFKRKHYYLHQIIYLMHHGMLPDRIDHQDGDSLNNKIENLRPASQSENIANSQLSKSNTSGYKGVIRVTGPRIGEKWAAQITVDGRCLRLGRYTNKEDAAKAYADAALHYFGKFSRPQSANDRSQDKTLR